LTVTEVFSKGSFIIVAGARTTIVYEGVNHAEDEACLDYLFQLVVVTINTARNVHTSSTQILLEFFLFSSSQHQLLPAPPLMLLLDFV